MLDTKQKPVEETNSTLTAPDSASGTPNSLAHCLKAQQGRVRLQQGKNQPQAASGAMEKARRKEPPRPKADTAPEGTQGFAEPAQIPSFFISKD